MNTPGGGPTMLDPLEVVEGRPFTAIEHSARDLEIMTAMLADVLEVLEDIDRGRRVVAPYQKLVWKVDGLTHRLLLTDEERLRAHPGPCVVGFFGERHIELDPSPLEEANTAIVADFADYPGILSYGSIEVGDGRWANLVLHDDPVDREYWRRNPRHAEAVRVLSPVHYKHVRIHNARLSGPVSENPSVIALRTKYFDYTEAEVWRAERPSP